jgi:dTDP-4-dehydrorhamnose reductase
VNARASGALASACKACGATLVYISTDAVFPGDRGGYTEDDPTGPVNAYGRSKLEGERLVWSTAQGPWSAHEHLRPGPAARARPGRMDPARGRAREPFAGFSDVFFPPLSVTSWAGSCEACLAAGQTGVYHAAGTPAVSKERFAREQLRAFSLDQGLVRPGSVRDVLSRPRRPLNSALDGFRLAAPCAAHRPGPGRGPGPSGAPGLRGPGRGPEKRVR